MKPNLVSAGIDGDAVDKFLEGVEELALAEINQLLDILKSLEAGAYTDYMKIYGLQPPSYWEHLKHLGECDLAEQKLLRPLTKSLRRAWRESNVRSKKSAKSDSPRGDTEGVSVRSKS